MDRLLRFLSLSVVVMLGGCTAMMESSSYGSGDLYITNNRERVAQELTARAEAEMAEAEMRRAMYSTSESLDYSSILADDYESAYARRLYGFNSPTYRLPASYYNIATNDAMRYATAYDPAFYNIMVSGDQVWVEPKYVTSMFGTWGATNVTYGIYSSPWIYGWSGYYSPYYYTMWGYPHYSWYDWHWNVCYNPYHWGCGYYAGYYPHHHHHHGHYYPHYPSHNKPSSGDRFHASERRNSSSRYSYPTSGYSRNGKTTTTIRNGSATSSGMNNSRVNRGTSSNSSRSSSTSRSTTRSGSSSNKSSGRTLKSSSTSVGSAVSSSSSSSSSRSSSSSTLRSSGSSSSSRSSGSSSLNRSSSRSSSSSSSRRK